MRIGLISDTHGLLRPQVFDIFEGVELILHGGDVGTVDEVDRLGHELQRALTAPRSNAVRASAIEEIRPSSPMKMAGCST